MQVIIYLVVRFPGPAFGATSHLIGTKLFEDPFPAAAAPPDHSLDGYGEPGVLDGSNSGGHASGGGPALSDRPGLVLVDAPGGRVFLRGTVTIPVPERDVHRRGGEGGGEGAGWEEWVWVVFGGCGVWGYGG